MLGDRSKKPIATRMENTAIMTQAICGTEANKPKLAGPMNEASDLPVLVAAL